MSTAALELAADYRLASTSGLVFGIPLGFTALVRGVVGVQALGGNLAIPPATRWSPQAGTADRDIASGALQIGPRSTA